jgi:hypothetical protein
VGERAGTFDRGGSEAESGGEAVSGGEAEVLCYCNVIFRIRR